MFQPEGWDTLLRMVSEERVFSTVFSFDTKLDEIVSAIKTDREEVAYLKELIDRQCERPCELQFGRPRI